MALFALLACCGCVVGSLARARSAEESVLAFTSTCAVVRGWQCETQSDMDVRAGIVDSGPRAARGLRPWAALGPESTIPALTI